MAESIVVNLILNKLTPILEEKVQSLIGLSDEVEFIKEELERMRAFLSKADAAEDNDDVVKVWVKQVREVAHNIEDVLDEYMLSFAHPDRDGLYAPLLKIKSSIRNLKARFRIASSLKGIKARICTISEGHDKYTSNQLVQRSPSTGASDRWYDPRVDALLQKVEPVGIETPRRQLIEWLKTSDRELKVFPVVGMGGLGKTTLVREVYNDPKIKNSFTNHIWITVSESFKIEKLLKDIIEQLCNETKLPIPLGLEDMNSSTLKGKINEFLLQSKYVLVLDDIWSTDAWESMIVAFPNNKRGSRVMITTRNKDIASTSSWEFGRNEISLQRLSDEDSWDLFVKKTFQNNCPTQLEETCRSILTKCEGLPLAIVAISGVLATKEITEIDEWDLINRSLNVVMKESSKLKRAERILSISYTEGFVKATEGRTPEEEAKNYLRQLLVRNLIQVAGKTSDGRVKMCHVHNFLREIIKTKATDQNIADIVSDNSPNYPKHVRRLSLNNTLLKKQHTTVRQIRSLFMFGELVQLTKSSVPILFSGGLRLLTVLELTDAPLDTFPDAVVKLYHLRYLSLRNTKVKIIPDSIQNLRSLQTLDLKHTHVSSLPVQILKLERLRHLLVYRYELESYTAFGSKHGFQVPLEIGNLQFLQKLCYIEADQSTSAIMLSQLEQLQQLRRLGVIKLKMEDGRQLCSTIERLSNLRALSLMSRTVEEILDLKHITSPPKFLQRLYLAGPLESLPQWIPSLQSLVKVFLKWSRIRHDPLQSLEDLNNLLHLELLQVCEEKALCFKSNKFQKLKLLNIDKFDALESMIVEEGAMPILKKLIIQRCEFLNKVPFGIEGLANLKVLEFFGMPDELIFNIRDKDGPDHGKVAHIPEVYSNNWLIDRWTTDTLRGPSEAKSFHQPSTEHFVK